MSIIGKQFVGNVERNRNSCGCLANSENQYSLPMDMKSKKLSDVEHWTLSAMAMLVSCLLKA